MSPTGQPGPVDRGFDNRAMTQRLLRALESIGVEPQWPGWIVEYNVSDQPEHIAMRGFNNGRVQEYDEDFDAVFVQYDCGDALWVRRDTLAIDWNDISNEAHLLSLVRALAGTWKVHVVQERKGRWRMVIHGQMQSERSPTKGDCYLDTIERLCRRR